MARAYKSREKLDTKRLRISSESAAGDFCTMPLAQVESIRQDTPNSKSLVADGAQGTMAEIMASLVSVVAQEAQYCERLLALMRCQQRLLIQGNARSIEANVREQESALLILRCLERRRQGLVSAFAADSAQHFGTSDVGKVIATVFNDYGNRLSGLHSSMRDSIQRLNETKEQNRLLIERSLANINKFIGAAQAAGVQDDSC